MAITDIINDDWHGHSHGEVEDALKAKLLDLSEKVEDLADMPDASGKQDVLVSGMNIKTINNESVLGQGNIRIDSSGSDGTARSFIDKIQERFDALIDALGNYAFPNGKNSSMKVGALPWSEGQGGGTTPSVLPVLTYPTSGSTVSVGTNTGSGVSKTVYVKGSNLTKALNVVASGSGFSVSPTTISAENANAGVNLTVTYNGTTASANGALTIISDEVVCAVNLTAVYSESVEPATPTLISPTDVSINLGTIAANDSSVSVHETVRGSNITDDGLTVAVTGEGFSVAPTTITKTEAETGQTITITYTNSETQSSLLTETGSLQISGGGITTKTIALTASKEAGSVTPEPVGEYYDDGHLELHLNGKALTNSATSWVDGDKVFTLQGGAAVHLNSNNEPDGVVFDGSSTSVAAVFSPANNVINFPTYIDGTIEIVFTPLTGFVSGGRPLFVTNNGDNTYDICAHWVKSVHGLCFVSSDNQSNKQYGTAVLNTFNDGEMQIVSATMPSHPLNDNNEVATTGEGSSTTADNWEYLIIHNGEKLTGHPTLSSSSSNKESGAGRLRLGSMLDNTLTDRCSPVIIHEVRVYDCHLTEEQMRANQEIDAERYGVTLTTNS